MNTDDRARTSTNLEATLHAAEGTLPGGDNWAGTTLGKYRIVRKLGMGGMGVVYEAVDPLLQRGVAIKVLREGIASKPKSVRQFMREARAAARLNHTNVVHVYEADQEKGMIYLVMELMENGSAHDRIHKWGPFGWVEATQVMLDACRGLAAVHAAGMIHRDMKPSNIMRAGDGTVKLADFGLALTSETLDDRTPQSNVVGTPLYMSPEQCRGEMIDLRSDIYAVGATYYTLLTGKPPFEGKAGVDIMHGHCAEPIPDPRSIAPSVPQACYDFICRTMGKCPDDRPESVAALLDELEHILTLATRIEMPKLEWAIPTPLSNAETEVLTQVRPAPTDSHTRQWFVLICLLLIGITFLMARYFRQMPPPNEGGGTKEAPQPVGAGGADELSRPPQFVAETGGPVSTLAFDPDDSGCISWGTETGREVVVLYGTQAKVHDRSERDTLSIRQVAFSSNDLYWGSLCEGRLTLRDARKFEDVSDKTNIGQVKQADIIAFAFHPNKPLIALALKERSKAMGGIVLHWLDGRAQVELRDRQWEPRSLAFSRDGSLLAAGCENGHVQTLQIGFDIVKNDKSALEQVRVIDSTPTRFGYSPVVAAFALEQDDFILVDGKEVRRFNLRKGEKKDVLYASNPETDESRKPNGASDIAAAALPPRGDTMFVAIGNRVIFLNRNNGTTNDTIELPSHDITALATNTTGTVVAVGTKQGKVFIWPVK
jgi:serine/threonine protein kinase